MDTGAIERLAERMRRSGVQEASIAKDVANRREREFDRQRQLEQNQELDRGFGIE